MLWEQLGGRRRLRLTDGQRCLLGRTGKRLGCKGRKHVVTIVTPETVLKWYREHVAKKYTAPSKRLPGRPRTAPGIAQLVVGKVQENSRWVDLSMIQCVFSVLGHRVGRNTVKRLLLGAGLEPAPERSRGGCWSTFLRAHWDAIAAADFFTGVRVLAESWFSHGKSLLAPRVASIPRRPKSPAAKPIAAAVPRYGTSVRRWNLVEGSRATWAWPGRLWRRQRRRSCKGCPRSVVCFGPTYGLGVPARLPYYAGRADLACARYLPQ